MSLEEFLDFKNYVDIQSSFDLAIHKDQEQEMKRNQDGRK